MPKRLLKIPGYIGNNIKNGAWALIGFLVSILVLSQAYSIAALIESNEQAVAARAYLVAQAEREAVILSEVKRGTQRIEDCTTAGGVCFKANAQRTAKVVTGIGSGTVRINVAIASCEADGFTSQAPLTRCAISRLKAMERQGPSPRR